MIEILETDSEEAPSTSGSDDAPFVSCSHSCMPFPPYSASDLTNLTIRKPANDYSHPNKRTKLTDSSSRVSPSQLTQTYILISDTEVEGKEQDEAQEASKQMEEDRKDSRDVDNADEDGEQCSICLQALVDRTIIPTCAHEFCFECILVWTGMF